jgi:hypothetical protein
VRPFEVTGANMKKVLLSAALMLGAFALAGIAAQPLAAQ